MLESLKSVVGEVAQFRLVDAAPPAAEAPAAAPEAPPRWRVRSIFPQAPPWRSPPRAPASGGGDGVRWRLLVKLPAVVTLVGAEHWERR
jgi:hypothetical protein